MIHLVRTIMGATERAVALIVLVVFTPVLTLAALVTWFLSRRSPFVCHLRIGQHGVPFWMLKLRTMWISEPPCTRESGLIECIKAEPWPGLKKENDPRIPNRFARFCRRYSIDELPQLVHVVSGRMSVVGPRPLTESELRSQYGVLAKEVLSLRPGITGLWQVLGRGRLSYP